MTTDIIARLEALESQQAISDVILRHAEVIRSGRLTDGLDLFVPEAVYELGHFVDGNPSEVSIFQRIEGATAIVGSKDEVAGSDARLWPMIHNIRVEVDGDYATSTCVSMTSIWPTGDNFIGEYRDQFRRDGGVWRFVLRQFIGFGSITGVYAQEAHDDYDAELARRRSAAGAVPL